MPRSWEVDESGVGRWVETGPFSAVDLMENLLKGATGISGLGPWAAGLYNQGADPTEIVQTCAMGRTLVLVGSALMPRTWKRSR